jgi:hypothetical protein
MTNTVHASNNSEELLVESESFQREIDALLPVLAASRRNYMRTRSEADRVEIERLEKLGADLASRHASLYDRLKAASGLPQEILEALDKPQVPLDAKNRMQREDLQMAEVKTTGLIDHHLAGAIESVERLLPGGWADEQAEISHRLDALFNGTECLSLVKGLRPESETSPLHRTRQMLRVAKDYLAEQPAYDHFGGALLVPQLGRFDTCMPYLDQVGGDVHRRMAKLREASTSVDATIFELFVAGRCVEYGRRIEFIDPTQESSPDIRCHDPFPLLIECKRKNALSGYELREEAVMRGIFLQLEREASAKGLTGRFDLTLNVEVDEGLANEIVARLIAQRLAARPERAVNYHWGSVAYYPLPRRIGLPAATRLYSPDMLQWVFDWNSDMPAWDGIVCRVDGRGDALTDNIRQPIALVWNNASEIAIRRRAWSPQDLFGDAMNQITPGEFGIVYLAYHEGARAEIADQRTTSFLSTMKETWHHPASIRIPISFLIRLYPRAIKDGQPDLIESTVPLYAAYGDPRLAEDFPATVFTNSPRDSQAAWRSLD